MLKLSKPFLNKGYNITTDNLFTSLRLAYKLSTKKTTLVGTVRGNRHELAPDFVSKRHAVNSIIQGYSTAHHAVLVSSYPKKGKLVNILSMMHSLEAGVAQGKRNKPEVIQFYTVRKKRKFVKE